MSKIRSKGTKIEMRMKKGLEEKGFEFTYQPKLFGKPDFFIPPNIVVFCDSSFWHGRNWSKLRKKLPKEYWVDHIGQNRKRDREVNLRLRKEGFVVLRFWDDQINDHLDKVMKRIKKAADSSAECSSV